jgi:hypothetical protein
MYTRFNQTQDIVSEQAQELITSTWTDNTNNLASAHTSSVQADFSTPTSSGHFYLDVYNKQTSDVTSEVQYSIAYGHRYGSGSPDFTNDTGSFGLGASKVTYNQYRQLHFGNDLDSQGNTQFFEFGDHTPDGIYVININRSRYKNRLTLGSLNLKISGTAHGQDVSADQVIELTDDSVTVGTSVDTNLGPRYNIVSGSNGVLSGSNLNQLTINNSGSRFGHYYPHAGIIILNGDAFKGSLRPVTSSGAQNFDDDNLDKNTERLYRHISGAGTFIVDTTEQVTSTFFFCRATNGAFNYTNNSSFVDANGNIRHETMKLNPKTFITTVGLYNDAFELLAVAKLSQPVAKDFTKEALIRVKLDY